MPERHNPNSRHCTCQLPRERYMLNLAYIDSHSNLPTHAHQCMLWQVSLCPSGAVSQGESPLRSRSHVSPAAIVDVTWVRQLQRSTMHHACNSLPLPSHALSSLMQVASSIDFVHCKTCSRLGHLVFFLPGAVYRQHHAAQP